MIVEMAKATVICLDSDREETLDALSELGVMHVVDVLEPGGDELEGARARLERAQQAFEAARAAAQRAKEKRGKGSRLRGVPAALNDVPSDFEADLDSDPLEQVIGLAEARKSGERLLEEMREELLRVEPLGDFDPSLVEELTKSGLQVKLLRSAPDAELAPPEDALLKEIGIDEQRQTYHLLVAVHPLEPAEIAAIGAAGEVKLPQRSLSELRMVIEEQAIQLERLDAGLASIAPRLPGMEQAMGELEQSVQMARVRAGMGEVGRVRYLQGYVPVQEVKTLRSAASRRGWGLQVREPEPTERVPTLLRQPRWVRPIGVLFNVLRISPAYREVDVSWAFLAFFTLFVGLLVGDAGYGLLVLALALFLTVKARGARNDAVTLLYALSLSVILFGAMQGSWLGIADLPSVLRSLRVEWLADQTNVMELCFLIGAVHMTLAHVWTAIGEFPRLAFLAQIGWVALVWSMFFVARALVLGRPFPGAVIYVLAAGVVLVAAFLMPPARMRQHLMEYVLLPLTLVGFFVDVISYIRLFAVGVATLAVAQSFNSMAASIGYDGVPSAIFAAIVLIFGHSLNLVLCLLAVLVHGVRLNTLEFSAHKGLTWSGFPFRPFSRRSDHYVSSAS